MRVLEDVFHRGFQRRDVEDLWICESTRIRYARDFIVFRNCDQNALPISITAEAIYDLDQYSLEAYMQKTFIPYCLQAALEGPRLKDGAAPY